MSTHHNAAIHAVAAEFPNNIGTNRQNKISVNLNYAYANGNSFHEHLGLQELQPKHFVDGAVRADKVPCFQLIRISPDIRNPATGFLDDEGPGG